MAEESTLEELRRRLDEVRSRHEVDGAAAARAFWRTLRSTGSGAPPDESAAGSGAAAEGSPRGAGPSAGDDGAAGCRVRRGSRTGGAWTHGSVVSGSRGVWAHLAPGDDITVAPRQMAWTDDLDEVEEQARWRAVVEPDHAAAIDHEDHDRGEAAVDEPDHAPAIDHEDHDRGEAAVDEPDHAPAMDREGDDRGWAAVDERSSALGGGPARAPADDGTSWTGSVAGAAGLVGLQVDAITGRPLDRHGEFAVLVAAEQAASLRGQHDVMLVNLVAELEARGAQSPGGLSRVDWLRSLDPGMTAGQAKAFVTVARAITDPAWAQLAARVTMRHVTVGKAALIIDFHQRTVPVADPDDLTTAVHDLIGQAPQLTPEDLARLARHHSEQIRPPREQERLDAGRQGARGLWFGQPSATGMVTVRGTLDPEAAAIIKSAVDPLAAPSPARDEQGRTIASDPRTPAKRRADALLEVVQRGVASAEKVPTTDKAKIVVTIDHDVLAGRLEGTGLAMTGDVLSASTVRRLACDAAIVPMVLGGASEPLELGRERRLVTKGLRLALWQRDGGCSFPGCSVPASWCDAHHVVPWYLGGHTNLRGMALLCRRHHTHVHRRELTATVTTTSVTWHE